MSIPTFQDVMINVLRAARHDEVRVAEIVPLIADEYRLTPEERTALIPSGSTTVIKSRIDWAASYLVQAKLLERPKRGFIKLTERGRQALAAPKEKIDISFLKKFPEFIEFQNRSVSGSSTTEVSPSSSSREIEQSIVQTPEDLIRTAANQYHAALASELLDRIVQSPPEFFEKLLIKLLVGMGYGGSSEDAGRALGRSGDDGVDGVVDGDPLGLDRVFVQAKRYSPGNLIGSGAIRDFFGALNLQRASKGVLFTTSGFTKEALDTAVRCDTHIILVDGKKLTDLMIRHGVGVRIEERIDLKKIDEDFFE